MRVCWDEYKIRGTEVASSFRLQNAKKLRCIEKLRCREKLRCEEVVLQRSCKLCWVAECREVALREVAARSCSSNALQLRAVDRAGPGRSVGRDCI